MFFIRTIFIFILVTNTLFSSAQTDPGFIDNLKPYYLSFPENSYCTGNFKIPFNSIQVLDYRYDTTKLGFLYKGVKDKKIMAKHGIEKTLTRMMNQYFRPNLDSSSGNTLLIIVKKLWLHDEAVEKIIHNKNPTGPSSPSDNPFPPKFVCLSSFDVFAGDSNSYKALLRFEEKLQVDFDSKKETDLNLPLLGIFDALAAKINTLNVAVILKDKKNIPLSEIRNTYNKRYDFPVLKEELKKGIFLTFDDFKNNRASYPDFEYKKKRYSTNLSVKINGEKQHLFEYWGFFDGTDLYIKPAYVCLKTIRAGNTFDFYGNIMYLLKNTGGNGNSSLAQGVNEAIVMKEPFFTTVNYLLQVDMDTGKYY